MVPPGPINAWHMLRPTVARLILQYKDSKSENNCSLLSEADVSRNCMWFNTTFTPSAGQLTIDKCNQPCAFLNYENEGEFYLCAGNGANATYNGSVLLYGPALGTAGVTNTASRTYLLQTTEATQIFYKSGTKTTSTHVSFYGSVTW
jgi:hypothetical protein